MSTKTAWQFIKNFFQTYGVLLLIVLFVGYHLFDHFQSENHDGAQDFGYAEESMAMNAVADFAPSSRMAKLSMPGLESGFVAESEDRKVVKNAQLTLEVDDTEVKRFEIEQIVKKSEGNVVNMNSWQIRPGILGYNLSIRIPAENLEAAVQDMAQLGTKISESLNSSDITAQYEDAASQLTNLESRRDRLREMLERDTKNLADVLSVDRELSTVQQQIERLEQTQNRRNTDVAYSQLHVTLQPVAQIGDTVNPAWTAEKSWKNAVNKLISTLQNSADILIEYAVLAPVWFPILLIVWFVWRKQKKTGKKKK